jgi:hypothetical protein
MDKIRRETVDRLDSTNVANESRIGRGVAKVVPDGSTIERTCPAARAVERERYRSAREDT